MPDGTLATALRLLSFLGSTVIGIRLWSWRLWRRYPFFFIFLALLAAWALGTLCLDVRSKAFYRFWKYTTPVTWIVDVLMVAEPRKDNNLNAVASVPSGIIANGGSV